MATLEDVHAVRIARTELTKRGVDISRADIRVTHGICYIRGMISAMRGAMIPDIHEEMLHITRILRQRREIKDISLEVTYLTGPLT